jgi:REP element-mobilizing transposase RayT
MQKIYKKLPHIDTLEHYQFVTFRTQDSLDDYLRKIESFDLPNSKKQMQIDSYLDTSDVGRYFEGEVLEYMRSYLLSLDGISYELVSFSIMPNHIHILFYQKQELSLILQRLKGATAKEINKILKKTGKFWASGYYDKAIRDEKHFEVVYNYIQNNPLKAGVGDEDVRYYSRYTDIV